MGNVGDSRNVFLSYASEDRDTAAAIARAIEDCGFSVWWDADIPTGVHYPASIESALKSAGCVVVLWSKNSVGSRWVRNEADWGVEHSVLVPIQIDNAEIPWEFKNIQALDLTRWTGDRDAPEFAKLIAALAEHVPTTGHAPETSRIPNVRLPKRRAATLPRWVMPTIATLAILIATAIGIRWWTAKETAPDLSNLTYTPLTGDGHNWSSALSPDGKYLAYVPMVGEECSLRLKQIDTGNESVLVPRGKYGIRSPVFSPDGAQVYFTMIGPEFNTSTDAVYDLYRVSMLGGEPQLVTTGIVGLRFAISPDGTQLAYKRTTGDTTRIFVAQANGTEERSIAAEPRPLTKRCCLAWAAGGDAVFSTSRDTLSGAVLLLSIPIDGGVVRRMTPHPWQTVMDLHMLADGSGLLVIGSPVTDGPSPNMNLWLVGSAGAEPRQITNDITMYYQVSASATGKDLALTHYAMNRTLRVFNVEDGVCVDVSTDVVPNGRVEWAGPGRLVVNQRVGNRIGIAEVGPGSGATSKVNTEVAYVSELDVSNDGQEMVFISAEGARFSLWHVPRKGGVPRRLTEDGADDADARYAPDGSWLATMHRTSPGDAWMIRGRTIDSDHRWDIADVSGRSPRVSPDGQQVAAYFLDEETGRYSLGVAPSHGGPMVSIDRSGSYRMLEWSPDGTALTCYRRDGESILIEDVPLDGGRPRPLQELPAGGHSITDADWNAAGDSLAVCFQSVTYDVLLVQGF